MKNKLMVLEHSNMMDHSNEIIQLKIPIEIEIMCLSITGFFLLVLMCLFTVKINDVKRESGIIRTMQNNSSVKNVISGKIEKICFTPEQFVHQGDILFSLEKNSFLAMKNKLVKDLENYSELICCMDLLIEGCTTGLFPAESYGNELIYSQLKEYFSYVSYLEKQNDILEYKLLKEKQLPPSLKNLQQVEECELNLRLSQKELEKYKASFYSDVLKRKNEYEIQLEKLKQEYVCLEDEYSFLDIRSPIDGYVQVISSLNAGDYVFANQEVLNIIPDDNKNFRVELSIKSKDIGEIYPGMMVKYRLSAFPFFEYKGAEGKIVSIDSDVRRNGNGELFYQAYADIDKVTFSNNKGNEFLLKAGIEVNAIIVMERIALIHFILRKLDFIE